MNPLTIGLLGASALLLVGSKRGAGREVKGQTMILVLRLPTEMTQEQLEAVMPPGATVQLDGDRAVVTFTAPTTAEITDFDTPLGRVHVESARRISDVVGAIDRGGEKYYTFSWWTIRDGSWRFSGYTSPKLMTPREADAVIIKAPTDWRLLHSYAWAYNQWNTVY